MESPLVLALEKLLQRIQCYIRDRLVNTNQLCLVFALLSAEFQRLVRESQLEAADDSISRTVYRVLAKLSYYNIRHQSLRRRRRHPDLLPIRNLQPLHVVHRLQIPITPTHIHQTHLPRDHLQHHRRNPHHLRLALLQRRRDPALTNNRRRRC